MKREYQLIAGVSVIGVALAALSFLATGYQQFVVGAWTVLPPVWFWVEYTLLTKEDTKNDPVKFARLKYSQELASKVWIAITVVLTAQLLQWPGK